MMLGNHIPKAKLSKLETLSDCQAPLWAGNCDNARHVSMMTDTEG